MTARRAGHSPRHPPSGTEVSSVFCSLSRGRVVASQRNLCSLQVHVEVEVLSSPRTRCRGLLDRGGSGSDGPIQDPVVQHYPRDTHTDSHTLEPLLFLQERPGWSPRRADHSFMVQHPLLDHGLDPSDVKDKSQLLNVSNVSLQRLHLLKC